MPWKLFTKNPSLHGPVAMGNCKVCHSPHFAENKFLLIRTGRNLCLHCHESTYVYENKHHFATDEYQCLDCHDPHSGKDRFLLTKWLMNYKHQILLITTLYLIAAVNANSQQNNYPIRFWDIQMINGLIGTEGEYKYQNIF